MNPSLAMDLVSAGVRSVARTVVNASALTSATARRFSLRLVFIVRFFRSLVGFLLHLLRERCTPLPFGCLFFGPVEAHGHDKGTLRRGEPVAFLILAGGFVLNEQCQPAVGILFKLRQHR